MPDGRFVSKSISTNEQLAGVSWQADLFFGKCIPHLDVEGRLTGNPQLLKSIVVPLRSEIMADAIPELLRELGDARDAEGIPLVRWYEVGTQRVLAFPGFRGQQKGMKPDREAASRLPGPADTRARFLAGEPFARTSSADTSDTSGATPEEVRTDSGVSPDEVPRKSSEGEGEVEVQVEGEVKGRTATATGARARAPEPPPAVGAHATAGATGDGAVDPPPAPDAAADAPEAEPTAPKPETRVIPFVAPPLPGRPGEPAGSEGATPGGEPPRLPARQTPRDVAAVKESIATIFGTLRADAQRRLRADELRRLQAEMVFAYWALVWGVKSALLDDKRERLIIARLKENRGDVTGVSELFYAIDGAKRNDYAKQRKGDLKLILGERSRVEEYASNCAPYDRGEVHPKARQLAELLAGADAAAAADSHAGSRVPGLEEVLHASTA